MPDVPSSIPSFVEMSQVATIFVTSIGMLDVNDQYVRLTLCDDMQWGGKTVQERQIKVRLVFPRDQFGIFVAQLQKADPALAQIFAH